MGGFKIISLTLPVLFDPRCSNDLLVEGGDVDMKGPYYPGEHVCPGGIRTHNCLIRSPGTGSPPLVYGLLSSTVSNLCGYISPPCLINPLLNSPSAPHLHRFEKNAVNCYYKLTTRKGSLQTCPKGEKPLDPHSSDQELTGYRLCPLPICGANLYETAIKLPEALSIKSTITILHRDICTETVRNLHSSMKQEKAIRKPVQRG
jgi:hypothetical protein